MNWLSFLQVGVHECYPGLVHPPSLEAAWNHHGQAALISWCAFGDTAWSQRCSAGVWSEAVLPLRHKWLATGFSLCFFSHWCHAHFTYLLWEESLGLGLFLGLHMNHALCIAFLGPTFAYMQVMSGVWLLHDVVLSVVDIFLNWYSIATSLEKETQAVYLCLV